MTTQIPFSLKKLVSEIPDALKMDKNTFSTVEISHQNKKDINRSNMSSFTFSTDMLCSQACINEARTLRKQWWAVAQDILGSLTPSTTPRNQGGNCQTFSRLKQKEALR